MPITIDTGAWNSVFAVPSCVVDEGLKFSDGVKLKVLLFVLRNSGRALDENEIFKATGVSPSDIPEAIDYWVSMGVFKRVDSNTLVPQKNEPVSTEPVQHVPFPVQSAPQSVAVSQPQTELTNPQNSVEPERKRFAVTKPQKPDFVFTAQRLAVDEELKMLVEETQTALGRVLSNSDISTLLMLKDTCGLPLDVIFMLVHYCVSIDRGNLRAIEKMGIQWADEGIYSLEAADEKIKRAQQASSDFSLVSRTFGLKSTGSPTKKQIEFANKWLNEWKFSPEMLREAYERCVNTKGSFTFSYVDGILKRWHTSGYQTLEQVQKYDLPPERKPAISKQTDKAQAIVPKQGTSYDIYELDKINKLDDIP